MKFYSQRRGAFRLSLNREEAIELLALLGNGILMLSTRKENRVIQKKHGSRAQHDDMSLRVESYFAEDPKRSLTIELEDLPLED